MIGKRAVTLALIAVVVIGVTTPFNQAHAQVPSSCNVNLDTSSVTTFVVDVLADGVTLLGTNVVTSILSKIPIIGGAFEPFDQAVDKLFDWWMFALLFGAIGSLAVYLAGGLVNYALALNAGLTINNAVVDTGFGIILNLVNLGFVIAIIVMAFATMFRRTNWSAQSSLARLIIAALLINFSLLIAGGILGVGTELTKVLASNACSENLVNQFNIVTINNSVDQFLKASASGTIEKVLLSLTSIFFASLLTIIGALTLFGIFLFLIARYIAVMVLLIFMPVIWLGLIFPRLNMPGIGNAWSGWWERFLKWVFFGPIMAFFLYLTVTLINHIGQLAVTGAGPVQAIAQMLVVVALSLGGLYAANKLSIAGAAFIYGGVAKVGAMGLTGIKNTAIGIASAPLKSEQVQKAMGWLAGGKLTIPGTKFKIPTGTKEVGRLGLQAEAAARGIAEKGVERYKGISPQQKNKILAGLRPDGAEYAKLLEELLKAGDLDQKLAKEQLTKRVKRGLEWSQYPKLYKQLEQFVVGTQKSLEELAKGNIDEAAKIVHQEIFEKAKMDKDFGKKIGVGGMFKELDKEKFKGDKGAYDKALKEKSAEEEMVSRALFRTSPEAVKATLGQMKTRAQRDNFEAAMNKVWTEIEQSPDSEISKATPSRVKQYWPTVRKMISRGYVEKESAETEDMEKKKQT